MGDLDHEDLASRVVNQIQDSIDAATQPVLLLTGKIPGLRQARVFGERADGIEDSLDVAAGNRAKVPGH
jgi:hypothetical protein